MIKFNNGQGMIFCKDCESTILALPSEEQYRYYCEHPEEQVCEECKIKQAVSGCNLNLHGNAGKVSVQTKGYGTINLRDTKEDGSVINY